MLTFGLEPGCPACWADDSGAAALTAEICSTPGRVSVATTAPAVVLPPGVSRVMTALPADADAGTAAIATEAVVGAAEPGAGHTRTALETAARLDSTASWAACAGGGRRMAFARREVDPGQREHDEHSEDSAAVASPAHHVSPSPSRPGAGQPREGRSSRSGQS